MGLIKYRANQGGLTRKICLAVVSAILSWVALSLFSVFYRRQSGVVWLVICVCIVFFVSVLSIKVLDRPRWADFLISVQSEVDKITWPSNSDVRRHTLVVLWLLFSLAIMVFLFDIMWQWMFRLSGFLQF